MEQGRLNGHLTEMISLERVNRRETGHISGWFKGLTSGKGLKWRTKLIMGVRFFLNLHIVYGYGLHTACKVGESRIGPQKGN